MKAKYLLILIIILGIFLRIRNIYPANVIIGFDQVRDFFDSRIIFFDRNIRIIGPTAGNELSLHHGVLFLYYILPPLVISGGNPVAASIFNSLINALTGIVLFLFARSLFKDTRRGLIAAFLTSVSFYFLEYAGWLSNPTATLFSVPIYYLGLWAHLNGKKWGLPLAFLFLGISIQFELFFIYLIPVFLLYWIIFRPGFPNIKTSISSIMLFLLSTSTMILTEIKFGLDGVKTIIGFASGVAKPSMQFLINTFMKNFGQTFLDTILPRSTKLGSFLLILVIFVFAVVFSKRETVNRRAMYFLLFYIFSPITMLLFGYHGAPWFLIALPPSFILISSWVLGRFKYNAVLISVLLLIAASNLTATNESKVKGGILLTPDRSAVMSKQIAVVDFTYRESEGELFGVNSVTNPLYVNAIWAYHYDWYGKSKYGYKPTWFGGDQLYPYNTLAPVNGEEKYLFLIIDDTPRIPDAHKYAAINWANKVSKLIKEESFNGITIQKRLLI